MIDIKVNAHSSIKVIAQGKNYYFDPFKITESRRDANYIFFTHSHYDHFSPDDVKRVMNKNTVFIAPTDMKEDILSLGVPEEKMFLAIATDNLMLSGARAIAVKAYNIGKKFHPKENGWLGYILCVDGKRVYIAGDTDLTPEAKAVNCDIALVPVGGTYTMNCKEAGELINCIRPKVVIPTHYGSIVGNKTDGVKFRDFVDKDIEVRIVL